MTRPRGPAGATFLLLAGMVVVAPSALATPVDTLFSATGAENDWFGVAVSGAGDVNGDGFADFIVGAYANDGGGPDAGRAYVFFGGTVPDTSADLVLTGATADYFGTSVAAAGDFNGDGYADVIVGAPANDRAAFNAGSAFVYFGGPAADSSADLILSGEAAEDFFGQSVAGAGDVNGDGFDDVIVGAWTNDAGGEDAGRAYLFLGGPVPDAIPDLVLTGEVPFDNFGFSVAGVRDLDHDGFDDLLVGAPYHDAGGYGAGRAYFYRGGATLDAIPDLILDGQGAYQDLGYSVGAAGDVNGDGFADAIVGAIVAGPTSAGRAYLIQGGAVLDASPDRVFDGQAAIDWFGCSVSGAGDVNGDGFDDLIVGACYSDPVGRESGRAYLYFGGSAMDTVPDVVVVGETELDDLGFSVSGAGDVNHDGRAEFVVGAPLAEVRGRRSGLARVYSVDTDTPTLLSLFRVEARDEGIELSWAFTDEAWAAAATLERSDSPTGPWTALGAEVRTADGAYVVLDADVVTGHTYFYRLRVSLPGDTRIFGPLQATAGLGVRDIALLLPFPNPANAGVTIDFDLPHTLPVTLELFDLHGRRLATLFQGRAGAGRHRATWSGTIKEGTAAPGVYWLCLRTSGGLLGRRLTHR